jgi:hypothetical protein
VATVRKEPYLTLKEADFVETQLFKILPKQPRVLDLFSGYHSYISNELNPKEIIGIGLNAAELAQNKRLKAAVVGEPRYYVIDLNKIRYFPIELKNRFDAVTIVSGILYSQNPGSLLQLSKEALKPAGMLFIAQTPRRNLHAYASIWRRQPTYDKELEFLKEEILATGLYTHPTYETYQYTIAYYSGTNSYHRVDTIWAPVISPASSPLNRQQQQLISLARPLIRKDLLRQGVAADKVNALPDDKIEYYSEGYYWLVLRVLGWPYLYKIAFHDRQEALRFNWHDYRTDSEFSRVLNEGEDQEYPLAVPTDDLSEGGVVLERQEMGIDLLKVVNKGLEYNDDLRLNFALLAQIAVTLRLFAKKMFFVDAALHNIVLLERKIRDNVFLVPALVDFDEVLQFVFAQKNMALESKFVTGKDPFNRPNLLVFLYHFLGLFIANRKRNFEEMLRLRFINLAGGNKFSLSVIAALLKSKNWNNISQAIVDYIEAIDRKEHDYCQYYNRLSDTGLTLEVLGELKRQIFNLAEHPQKIRETYGQTGYQGTIVHSSLSPALANSSSNMP